MIFLFSTLKIQRKKQKNYTKNYLYKKLKHSYTVLQHIFIHWLCTRDTQFEKHFFSGLFFSIWRDFKILRSIILLHLPIISNWDRETRGPPQEWECSLIWESEGLDRADNGGDRQWKIHLKTNIFHYLTLFWITIWKI